MAWQMEVVGQRPKNLSDKEAEAVLGDADLPCNRGGIRNHPKKSMVTSGVRLGSPALREVREALHHL